MSAKLIPVLIVSFSFSFPFSLPPPGSHITTTVVAVPRLALCSRQKVSECEEGLAQYRYMARNQCVLYKYCTRASVRTHNILYLFSDTPLLATGALWISHALPKHEGSMPVHMSCPGRPTVSSTLVKATSRPRSLGPEDRCCTRVI